MRKDVEAEPIDIHYDKLTDWLIRCVLLGDRRRPGLAHRACHIALIPHVHLCVYV